MLASMTGFGKGDAVGKAGKATCELRSVNFKYLDISVKVPNSLASLEERVKRLLQSKVGRGKIHCFISFEGRVKPKVSVNNTMAGEYLRAIKNLKRQYALQGKAELSQIISFPNVLTIKERHPDAEAAWPLIRKALDGSFKKFKGMRETEGNFLSKDLVRRVQRIGVDVDLIQRRASSVVDHYKRRLSSRIKCLSDGRALDNDRLAVEVALFARNCDITEEITRIKSHIKNLKATLKSKGEVGKRIDFIAQELYREANTIAAKANDASVSKAIIRVKGEIEKIREQAQNIE